MDFTFSMGFLGAAVLVLGALVLGVSLYLIGNANSSYEWLATGIAAVAGGFVASEFIVGFRDWAPVFDGLALVPALFGGVVVGLVGAVATRLLTGGTFAAHQTA